VFEMAPQLRRSDLDELDAALGVDAVTVLSECVSLSEFARVERCDGEIVYMYGSASHWLGSDRGSVWMVGTDRMSECGLHFLRKSLTEVPEITAHLRFVENYCDARNLPSLRWLSWLGFTIEEATPWGVKGLPFHHFWKEN